VLVFDAHIFFSKLVCCTVPVTKPRFVKFQIIQPKPLVLKVTLKEIYQVSIVLENSDCVCETVVLSSILQSMYHISLLVHFTQG